ncbi:MAG: Mobile element protein [uncultured Chloroflexia bacterium]|uniref:Mobile element protein n=1 Tax=uncultured Chloroflexia bacterium TaxID=1672391 RepID=A0A6J4MQT7_9CHLR|nr:MAG: Mobile element protein [uncultured Chloroflexia bacterium]
MGKSATARAFGVSLYSVKRYPKTAREGQIVVMDNLSSHKGEKVRELIEGRGCELPYLPPYSPDLNLIEEAFVKLKAQQRKAGLVPARP